MKLLKPLFFNKYKSKNTYSYPEALSKAFVKRGSTTLSLYFKEQAKAKMTIVLVHPMLEAASYYFIDYGHVDMYCRFGYNVVLFDFHGFGASTDDGSFDFKEDINAITTFCHQRFPHCPIGLHGVSFGGSQIILSAIDDEKQYAGLIVEQAVSSNLDYYKGKGNYLFHVLNAYNNFFPEKNAHNIYTDMVTRLQCSEVLYIYGDRDRKTPLWMGEKLYAATASPNKELVVFDVAHLKTIVDYPELYKQTIQKFWDRVLKRTQ